MTRIIAPFALTVGIVSLVGCSYRLTSLDGYEFDWHGETAGRQEEGDVVVDVRQIEIKNRFGSVAVEVAEGEPSWSWELTCWSSTKEMAETFVAETRLQIMQDADTQTWEVVLPEPPQADLRGVRSDLVLRVPASVHVKVDNSFGNTAVHDIQGGTIANSRHGNLEFMNLAKSLEATSEHGSIKAERIPAARLKNRHGVIDVSEVAGGLEIHNEHGKVTVARVLGELLVECQHGDVVASEIAEQTQISTSHASIQLEDADGDVILHNRHGSVTALRVGGKIVADNQHGPIDLNVESAEVVCTNQHGRINLRLHNRELHRVIAETSHSELRVLVPESISPIVKAHTDHGKIESDIPIVPTGTGGDDFESTRVDTPRVSLKNRHGNIFVRKFAPNVDSEL